MSATHGSPSTKSKLSVFVDVGTKRDWPFIVGEWNRLGIRGTFFVLPEVILENPRFWREACEMGHELGNPGLHKYSLDGELIWSRDAVKEDLKDTNELLQQTGQRLIPLLSLDSKLNASDGEYGSVLTEIFDFIVTANEGPNAVDHVNPQALLQSPLQKVDPTLPNKWWIAPYADYQLETLEKLVPLFDIAPIGEVAASIQAVKR